ncbi:hypothetical protein ACQKMN_15895 [Ureibacillus composti]
MKRFLLFTLIIFNLGACNQSDINSKQSGSNVLNSTTQNDMPKNMPDDFDFSIQFGVQKKNEINTFESTVTKDLITEGTATTEITLTEEEMNDIYEKMKEINIVETKKFTPEPVNGTICAQEPYGEDEWNIIMNGKAIKHFISEEYCAPTNDAKQLIELRNYVFNIVKSKDEYKALPEPKGAYQ